MIPVIRNLFVILSLIGLFSCNNHLNNQANADSVDNADSVNLSQEEKDKEVLAKLWPSSNFYKLKQYRFRTWEAALQNPDSVINLALYTQDLKVVPATIDTFKNLQLLGLDYNGLESLPDEMKNLTYLQKIHLNKNNFTQFPEVLTNNRYLKTILLSDNQLEYITPDIKNLVYLEDLVLNDNKLGSVPPEIFELKNLKVLGLRNNGLGQLPDLFDQLPHLEQINLQGNNLKEIPESITRLPLKKLTLKGNPIEYIDIKKLEEKMPSTEIEF